MNSIGTCAERLAALPLCSFLSLRTAGAITKVAVSVTHTTRADLIIQDPLRPCETAGQRALILCGPPGGAASEAAGLLRRDALVYTHSVERE